MLVTKEARLSVEVEKIVIEKSKPIQINVEEICQRIEGYSTREDALEYINGLSLIKNDLKAIAKKYDIPIRNNETNNQIVEKIIENVVGSRLKFDALLNTDLK